MKNTINIVAVSDNNYAQHLSVTLTSLIKNSSGIENIDLYIVDGGMSRKNKKMLQNTMKNLENTLVFISIDRTIYKNARIDNHITKAAYYRISLPPILNKEYHLDRVIYIDCDMIFNRDINKLWNINLANHTIGAIENLWADSRIEYLHIPKKYKYFNSGLLMIDTNKWVKEDITNRTINYINRNGPRLTLHDQDALNAVLYNKWLALPINWNVQSKIYEHYSELSDKCIAFKKAAQNPYVIHYTGSVKPWNFECKHPLKKEYYNYLSYTEWKNWKPRITVKSLVNRFFLKNYVNF
ncbi:glycosyltransferase family 8 protein [Sporolactobacillus inulinus]|uniref:glycosyltransferase family 8 protein n=1 Tax=Sporolactobacillus inulinus TaxID=2078 RepID=UPI0021CC7E82|nr:glycosyltransferase family 8 protein [Sporolactobacillus inulinus]